MAAADRVQFDLFGRTLEGDVIDDEWHKAFNHSQDVLRVRVGENTFRVPEDNVDPI